MHVQVHLNLVTNNTNVKASGRMLFPLALGNSVTPSMAMVRNTIYGNDRMHDHIWHDESALFQFTYNIFSKRKKTSKCNSIRLRCSEATSE